VKEITEETGVTSIAFRVRMLELQTIEHGYYYALICSVMWATGRMSNRWLKKQGEDYL
jgi:hypothetical protein